MPDRLPLPMVTSSAYLSLCVPVRLRKMLPQVISSVLSMPCWYWSWVRSPRDVCYSYQLAGTLVSARRARTHWGDLLHYTLGKIKASGPPGQLVITECKTARAIDGALDRPTLLCGAIGGGGRVPFLEICDGLSTKAIDEDYGYRCDVAGYSMV